MIVFDLETNGLKRTQPLIVLQIAAFNMRTGRRFNRVIRPGQFPFEPGAEEMHAAKGRTREWFNRHGVNRLQAYAEFVDWVGGQPVQLAGHNILEFDVPYLRRDLLELGLPGIVDERRVFDTRKRNEHIRDRVLNGRLTLANVAKFYGVPLTDAHDALSDVMACAGIIRKMQA